MKLGLREVAFIVLLTGIPVVAWRFVFRPQNAQNAEMQKQIEAKQARLRELNQATGTIGDLRQRIEKLEKAMAFFRSKLPSEKEIDKVLQEVWQLAESNRLRTKSIRTLDRDRNSEFTSRAGAYCAQPISVQLEGSFLGFYSFLQALEDQPRIMRVQKMNLQKLKQGAEGTVQAEFIMTIFFEGTDRDKS